MTKTALITGIAGQDGSYLSEYLLSIGYNVCGMVRRNSITENQQNRIEHINDISLYYGDLLDKYSLDSIIKLTKPDEIYNLAAQSHVRVSFDIPEYTTQVNALGVINLLDILKNTDRNIKFYQASSSEMFGNTVDDDGAQRETTQMRPVSPYGCSKLFGYSIVRNYRISYNMFAVNGILFNHESPRRASNFVTSKIIKNAILIKKNKLDKLELGNLDAFRDWGHARDYVKAMHMIVSHDTPDDFVVATGETHSVRDFCRIAFEKLNLNYEDYVTTNEKYKRPEELKYLRGDSTKIKSVLGWTPTTSFESLIEEMLEYWDNRL